MELHNQIKSLFKQLPSKDQLGLLDELKSISTAHSTMHVEDKASPCPHCGSDKIIKHSKYKNGQRYKCKTYSRTFSPTTGTLIHHQKSGQIWTICLYHRKRGVVNNC